MYSYIFIYHNINLSENVFKHIYNHNLIRFLIMIKFYFSPFQYLINHAIFIRKMFSRIARTFRHYCLIARTMMTHVFSLYEYFLNYKS